MPRKSHILQENIPDQIRLVAIASHEPDYRISWLVNSALNIQLRKVPDHVIMHPGTQTSLFFSCFTFSDPDQYLEYHLVGNHSESGYLLSKYKNIDYFLHISGETGDDFYKNLIVLLRNTQGVIAAFELVLTEPRFIRLFQFS